MFLVCVLSLVYCYVLSSVRLVWVSRVISFRSLFLLLGCVACSILVLWLLHFRSQFAQQCIYCVGCRCVVCLSVLFLFGVFHRLFVRACIVAFGSRPRTRAHPRYMHRVNGFQQSRDYTEFNPFCVYWFAVGLLVAPGMAAISLVLPHAS